MIINDIRANMSLIDVLGERRLPRHSFDAGDLGKRGRKMWSSGESDSEDEDYKYENDDDDDDEDEREALKTRRRASVAVTQIHGHSRRDSTSVDRERENYEVTDDTTWLYRDPQGDTQGPFTNTEMNGWYEAGYFGPDLMVKREQDPTFVSLRILSKRNGATGPSTSPFTVGPIKRSSPVKHVSTTDEEEESSESEEELKQISPRATQQPSAQHPAHQGIHPKESALRKSSDVIGGMLLLFPLFFLSFVLPLFFLCV